MAGRAFAAGLATIQRKKMSGPHAKYRVRSPSGCPGSTPCPGSCWSCWMPDGSKNGVSLPLFANRGRCNACARVGEPQCLCTGRGRPVLHKDYTQIIPT